MLRAGVIVDNADMATGMERKEMELTPDIFWSREPIVGHKGTKENPAIIPSFNTSRVVGLETEQVRAPWLACSQWQVADGQAARRGALAYAPACPAPPRVHRRCTPAA